MSLTFRKASPPDTLPLLTLIRSAYRGPSSRAGWTTEADLVADDRIDAPGLVSKITDPNGAVLVASDPATGQTVACCEVLCREGGVAYFGLFAVDPKRQAGGVGRKVLEYAEAYAKKEWDARAMEMWVIWPRQELIAWYIRRGYKKTSRTAPFPYGHLVNGKALRDDLYFVTLEKEL